MEIKINKLIKKISEWYFVKSSSGGFIIEILSHNQLSNIVSELLAENNYEQIDLNGDVITYRKIKNK